jgi:PIN domain nuclease of toxin-antitoxin system
MGHGVKVLLDTHAQLWWLEDGKKLSRRARQTIQNQKTIVLVSAASAWEIAIKSNAGKLEAGTLIADFRKELEREGFTELAISADHTIRAGLLEGRHKDPFDRMLAAQAQAENLVLISKDKFFDRYAVRRVW